MHFVRRRILAWWWVCLVACEGTIASPGRDPQPPSDIHFSVERGIYSAPFDLEVATRLADASLRYTLDGSDPRTSPTARPASSPLSLRIDPDSTDGRFTAPTVIVRVVAMLDDVPLTLVSTHSYLFLNRVTDLSPDDRAPGAGWPDPRRDGDQRIDYGMDPDVYDDPSYASVMLPALSALPSIVIATDLDHLFDASTGIYMNALQHGDAWERPASFEILYADGRPPLQINSGLRIRGGYSRHDDNPKHAFRLFFRSEYGAAKLRYPLFEGEGASEFDKVDLRTAQNYSWSYRGEATCTMNRDVFSRDTQREMDRPYTRSRYYHLYLDGVYWGIYQTQERSEADYAAMYLGGSSDDYDVIKMAADNDYQVEATDGTLDAWREVFDRTQQGFTDDADYFALEGKNAQGTRDASLPVWVDVDSLIDYMLVIFYTGNIDAPVSKFLTNQKANNFYALRNRVAGDRGFIFFAHDSEHTLFAEGTSPHLGLQENRVSIGLPGGATNGSGDIDDSYRMQVSELSRFQPQWLHHRLTDSARYRERFAQRARAALEGNGVLTPAAGTRRFLARARELETAIVAESARWGDANVNPPRTRDDDWQPAIDDVVDNFFPRRTEITIEQLRAVGLY